MIWPNIKGWSADCDRTFLYEWAIQVKARTIVEIGVYAGRITVALAAAAKENSGVVYCVDPWEEMPNGEEIARKFLRTVTENDLQDVVRIYAETSAQFASRLKGEVDLVWVDGGHGYDDVMTDLTCWRPRTKALFGHDWHLPSVRAAVMDYAAAKDRKCWKLEGSENVWVLS